MKYKSVQKGNNVIVYRKDLLINDMIQYNTQIKDIFLTATDSAEYQSEVLKPESYKIHT